MATCSLAVQFSPLFEDDDSDVSSSVCVGGGGGGGGGEGDAQKKTLFEYSNKALRLLLLPCCCSSESKPLGVNTAAVLASVPYGEASFQCRPCVFSAPSVCIRSNSGARAPI